MTTARALVIERVSEKAHKNISRRLKPNEESKVRFITKEHLREVWNESFLEEFFNAFGSTISHKQVTEIREQSIQVLSILVFIGCIDSRHFENLINRSSTNGDDLKDSSLPLQANSSVYPPMKPSMRRSFIDRQYDFLPIIIDDTEEAQQWNEYYRLPFVEEPQMLDKGAGGSVFKVRIARDHLKNQRWTNSESIYFARKVLFSKPSSDTEIKNLKTLRRCLTEHTHIATYLAMYKFNNQFEIIHDLAQANLRQFMEEERYQHYFDSPSSPAILLKEFTNLADALSYLHRLHLPGGQTYICCHMDLRPENILVFSKNGRVTLKITDLGISAMKEEPNAKGFDVDSAQRHAGERVLADRTRTTKTSARRDGGQTQAPEMKPGNKVGRASDVWSLGCILVLFLIRVFEQRSALANFNESLYKGYEDDYFYNQGYIKSEVNDWLSTLSQGREGYLERLMSIGVEQTIVEHVLNNLERLIRRCFIFRPQDRIKSARFVEEIVSISQQLPTPCQQLTKRKDILEKENRNKTPSEMANLKGLELYEEFFNLGQTDGKVSLDSLAWQFEDKADRDTVGIAFDSVTGNAPRSASLDINLTCAVVFMLHAHLLDIRPLQQAKVSMDVILRFKRFATWMKCTCVDSCSNEWNFANCNGIHRKRSMDRTVVCKADRKEQRKLYESWKQIS